MPLVDDATGKRPSTSSRDPDLGVARISSILLEVAEREYKQLILETSELRRSSRTRKEAPSYCDDKSKSPEVKHLYQIMDSGNSRSYCRRSYKSEPIGREYTGRLASYEEKVLALKRAETLLTQVASDRPSFAKSMLRSHVSSCFWLGLPTKFCRDHLPHQETKMILEDECGEEQEAIYIGRRTGLSGGWRSFAVDHKLEDGDALVFKLIELTRFKIYIVKAVVGSTDVFAENFSGENLSLLFENHAPAKRSEISRNSRKRKQSRPRPSN